jgi:hypothetical protein
MALGMYIYVMGTVSVANTIRCSSSHVGRGGAALNLVLPTILGHHDYGMIFPGASGEISTFRVFPNTNILVTSQVKGFDELRWDLWIHLASHHRRR